MLTRIIDPDRDEVFFYASAGKDYLPVHRMDHDYDTYVLVDLSGDLVSRMRVSLAALQANGSKYGFECVRAPRRVTPAQLGCSHARFAAAWLSPGERQAYHRCLRAAGSQDDGLVAVLNRRVGGTTRRVKVIVLQAEAVATLHALFFSQGFAPRALCLLRPGPAPMSWTGFTRWDGPLARTMRVQVPPEKWPEIVLFAGGDRRFDWPYPHSWQGYEGWKVSNGFGRFNPVVARARGPISNLQANQLVSPYSGMEAACA